MGGCPILYLGQMPAALVQLRPEARIPSTLHWYKRHMRQRGYSANTMATYSSLMDIFLRWLGERSVRSVTHEDIVDFNAEHILDAGKSASYQRQSINAIKLFYSMFDGHNLKVERLERVKRAHRLPVVLSLPEVERLLAAYANLKHRALIVLTYSCGLRSSEVINLRWKDIDRKRMLLTVRLGKGMKDRQVVLPQRLIPLLETYWKEYRSKDYVFEGQAGDQYTSRSLSQVLKQGLRRARIRKKASVHTLRHSYATHLHEQGTDIMVIKRLLGHKSLKTTEIYTHLSARTLQGVRNPLDSMNLEL